MHRGALPRFFHPLQKSEHSLKSWIKYSKKMLIFQEFRV